MPNWKKVIISGSDAALNSLEITSDLTLGVDGTGGNLTAHSNTAGRALTWNKVTSALSLADNSAMKFGTGGDFNIAHNGSNTVFTCINGNVSFINYADDQDISFTVDQGGTTHQLMTLDGSANSVGIGTTTPSAKLNVKGTGTTSATTALLVEDSSGADLLEVNDLGNISIPNGNLSLNGDAEITGSLTVKTGDLFVSGSTNTSITLAGEIVLGYESQPVKLNRNKAVLVNSGTAPVATVDGTVFSSAHFDYVITKGTNLRAGTVIACHDGLSNVVFTEVSTADLGSTVGVTLDVIETGGNLMLQMTVPSTGWYIKTFVRAI